MARLEMGLMFLSLIAHLTKPSIQNTLTCPGQAGDIVFVLDSSDSIWQSDFNLQLAFVQDVVDLLPVGDGSKEFRFGLVTYSDIVRLQFHLGHHTQKIQLKHAISRVPYLGGGTYTGDAIKFVSHTMFQERYGARDSASDVIVIITDGLSQNTTSTAEQASIARYLGAKLYVIGVGPGVDHDELTSIASNPDNYYMFRVEDFESLSDIKEKLASRTCQPNPQRDGSSGTGSEDGSGPEVILPPRPPQNCGGKPAEVFFLVDSSNSIWYPDFERQLDFMKHVVKIFDIGPTKTRVGVVVFSDRTHAVIPLNRYEKKSDLLQAIDGIPYLAGSTDTAGAIRYLREEGLHKSVARRNVAHIGIILTDGQSQDVELTKKEAELAHKAGIYLFAIGIGGNMDKQELKDISSDPDESFVFMLDNFEALTSIQDILAIKTCDVQPRMQQDQVCRGGTKSDLVFAFNQHDLTSDETEVTLDFIRDVVNEINVGPDSTRVGLTLNDSPKLGTVDLSTYSSSDAFADHLGLMRVPNLTHLLHKIKHHSFINSRQNVRKAVVLFVTNKLDEHRYALREAHRLKREDVEIFVFAIGDDVKQHNMAAISSKPTKDHLFAVSNFNRLWNLKEKLFQQLCR